MKIISSNYKSTLQSDIISANVCLFKVSKRNTTHTQKKMFKVNNKNTRTMSTTLMPHLSPVFLLSSLSMYLFLHVKSFYWNEMDSILVQASHIAMPQIKKTHSNFWWNIYIFIHFVLMVSLFLTFNRFQILFWYFHYKLWLSKCRLERDE